MKLRIKQLLKNKIVKNASWIIVARIIQMITSFFVGILSARYLGPTNYGLINYANAYTAFFAAFCTLGLNSIIVRELVNHRDEEGKVLGTAIGLRLISSFFSALMIIGIVAVLDHDEPLTIVVVALCTIGVLTNVLETFAYWFQSHLKSKVSSFVTLIGYVVVSAYKIVLMILNKDIRFFAVATTLDYLVVGVLLIISYRINGGQKLTFSWKYGKELLKDSKYFILPAVMISIYAQTDKLMLKQMIGATENGYYSTAASIGTIWCFILSAINESLSPSIMEDFKNGNMEGFNRKNKILYALMFYISIFVSVLYCIFGPLVVSILYGEAYMPTVQPLRIIVWYTAFSYLGVARDTWIVCNNKQKYLIWVYLVAAVSNVVFNLIFIPILGASGAALASLLAQVVTILSPLLIKELRPNLKLMFEAICFRGLVDFKKVKPKQDTDDK